MIIAVILIVILTVFALPFIKEWLRVRSIKSDWQKNDREKAIQMIIEDIARAKERMLVYGGSGSIYNDNGILTALKSKNIDFEFVLENSKEDLSQTRFSAMAKQHEENIHIFSTQQKLFKHHFRVIDYNYVYIEKCHEPESHDRMFKRFPNTRFLPGEYSKTFFNLRKKAIPI